MVIQSSDREKTSRNRLTVFNPGLLQTGFFSCSEEWYRFQQEQMVSKTTVNLLASLINSFDMGL